MRFFASLAALVLVATVSSAQCVKQVCVVPVSAPAQSSVVVETRRITITPASATDPNREIIALVNAERNRLRRAPLISTQNNVAISAASVESMARNSNRTGRVELRHSGQDSVIGWNYQSPRAIYNGWMGSPGHRNILLDPRNKLAGFATAPSRVGPYWAGTLRR